MSTFEHGFPGITIWPIREGTYPSVVVDDSPSAHDPRDDEEIEAEWSRLTAANPRLFDGPILALAGFDPGTGRVVCRHDSYKRLTVQGEPEARVMLVAVNGIVTARDCAGREHVLLGRRSTSTRMYGGMWELIPAGGLEPPRGGSQDVPAEHLLHQLSVELREEAGLNTPITSATPVAFYRDEVARSFNIVFAAALSAPIEDIPLTKRDWDCDAALWLPRDEVGEFGRTMPIISASRGLLRMAGWPA